MSTPTDTDPARSDTYPQPSGSAFDATVDAVSTVDGWMTPGQAALLWRSAERVPLDGRIVEIGSFRGRSTIVLARGAHPTVEVVAIDPHAGNDRGPQEIEGFEDEAALDHEVFNANLEAAGVAERVRHVREFSDRAHGRVDDPIDLLYVDGAHRYQPAMADIRDWGRRVRGGGTLLIHDSFSSVGVTLALMRLLFWSGEWRYIGRSESMTEYRKEPVGSWKARVANCVHQCLELGWFARNLVIKALMVARLGRLTRLLGHDGETWPY